MFVFGQYVGFIAYVFHDVFEFAYFASVEVFDRRNKRRCVFCGGTRFIAANFTERQIQYSTLN